MNIVLVHGVLGFNQLNLPFGTVEYFSGVAEYLKGRFQAAVFAPALNPTEGTEVRSAQLRAAIAQALAAGQLNAAEPVHIIAHSLGGLDARRMIAEDASIDGGGPKIPVRALATISTPHRGSPIADIIDKSLFPKPGIATLLQGAGAVLHGILDHFKISQQSLHDLTSEAANDFNARFPDQPSVRYSSFAGRGRDGFPHTAAFFLPYYEYIQMRTSGGEQCDGVVTVASARWSGFDENLWPCDHADEIGHDLDHPLQPVKPELLDRYGRIVAGFQA